MQEISSMKARRAEYEPREASSGLSGDAVERCQATYVDCWPICLRSQVNGHHQTLRGEPKRD